MTYEEYREICNIIDRNVKHDISAINYKKVEIIDSFLLKNQIKTIYMKNKNK